MNKRQFLSLAGFGLGTLINPAPSTASSMQAGSGRSFTLEDVSFSWHHSDTNLIGSLSAPTSGWIAIGFNDEPSLKNTRFIMAVTSDLPIKTEEHLAHVTGHKKITELGLEPALQVANGYYDNGYSQLQFQMSQRVGGRSALSLARGSRVHVMLAWSHATSFDHHSAWRKHFSLTL